jgi:hypothetical protein
MIPLERYPEPPIAEVIRQKGANRKAGTFPAYWRDAVPELEQAANFRCAYLAHFTPKGEVDHFLPKDQFPELAYEWSNFRYSDGSFNNLKGIKIILDPFEIKPGWLVLNPGTFEFLIGPELPDDIDIQRRADETIKILNHPSYVRARSSLAAQYSLNEDYLRAALPALYVPIS